MIDDLPAALCECALRVYSMYLRERNHHDL